MRCRCRSFQLTTPSDSAHCGHQSVKLKHVSLGSVPWLTGMKPKGVPSPGRSRLQPIRQFELDLHLRQIRSPAHSLKKESLHTRHCLVLRSSSRLASCSVSGVFRSTDIAHLLHLTGRPALQVFRPQ